MYYPPALRTRLSTTRHERRTFCQRLARNLAHFDQHPEVWLNTIYKGKKVPPYLRLPPELRQSILSLAITDDELLVCPRPNSTTLDLTLVDKTFAADVVECMHLWDIREKQLKERRRKRRKNPMREHLARLAEDLLQPVRSHVAFRVPTRSACAKREAKLKQKMMGRVKAAEWESRWYDGDSEWYGGDGDWGEEDLEDVGQGEATVEDLEMTKLERRKERIKKRQVERHVLEMWKTAWIDRSRRRWEIKNPEDARLAGLRKTYSKGRPLAAHDFEGL